jgi:hypothetical protein
MKFGMIGASYTAKSNAVADEETINWYPETLETEGAQTRRSFFGTPGLSMFSALPEFPVRGQYWTGMRHFVVAGSSLYEVFSDGTYEVRGSVSNDAKAVSIAASNIQLLIVAAGNAYCFTLDTNTIQDVTLLLAGSPLQCDYADGYFIVCFKDSNKFQISDILDGANWPGIQVNAVSVFPENIRGIIVSHRELWVFGSQHIQPYQDTGSDEVFDVIPGSLIDAGIISTFARNLVDNTIFWISEDQRGAKQAWRANGYTPQRISTYAVETALSSYENAADSVSYSYQDSGHLFWVIYIPNTDCSWVYDVAEGLWHKRAVWNENTAKWMPHRSWNHAYAFGRHLVGDWQTGNLYEMSLSNLDDDGTLIRRLRRSPTLVQEMQWIYHQEIVADFAVGIGPQPPLVDGDGNVRPPQAMLRWSDDRGNTWSNEHVEGCGLAGQYRVRVIWRRLGRSWHRVYELIVSDPVPWVLVDSYLRAA